MKLIIVLNIVQRVLKTENVLENHVTNEKIGLGDIIIMVDCPPKSNLF